jgi:hypothetical protein
LCISHLLFAVTSYHENKVSNHESLELYEWVTGIIPPLFVRYGHKLRKKFALLTIFLCWRA